MLVFPTTHPSSRRLASELLRARLYDHQLHAGRERAADRPDSSAPRLPAIEVTETDTSYQVSFELPGLTKDQLKVSVLGRRVELETTEASSSARTEKRGKLLYQERSTPRYARTVSLPTEVEATNAVAKYENGVLLLTLAKKLPTGVTRLEIN